jgi:hypothetical protein
MDSGRNLITQNAVRHTGVIYARFASTNKIPLTSSRDASESSLVFYELATLQTSEPEIGFSQRRVWARSHSPPCNDVVRDAQCAAGGG